MPRYSVHGLLLFFLTAPFSGVRAQVPAADSLALVSLWNSAGGPGWAMNSSPNRIGWNSTTPEGVPTWVGEWHGVSVRDNRVFQVNLLRQNLVGQLSPGLAGLTRPTNIGIRNNSGETGNLHGPIPESYGSMKSLEQLFLTGNMLTGGIPDTLASLPNLRTLDLAINPLGGGIPAVLGRLPSLEDLNLGEAQLVGEIPPELGNLSGLTRLRLNNNRLTGSIPEELGQLSELTALWLQFNELSGPLPASIGNLANLSALRADVNQLEGPIPPSWGGLSSVRQLWLGLNNLSGPIPEELGNLSSLEFLTLASNELSGPVPDSFTRLTALRNLNIHENDFDGMPDLSGLPNLEQLRVFGNRFTFEHLEPMAGLLSNPRVTTFFYAPQDSVDLEVRLEGGQIVLSMPAGGEATEYRWFRDGVEVEGVTGSDYAMSRDDRGVIRAEATNPRLPDLILHSRPLGMVMVVNSTSDAHNRSGAAPGFCDTGAEILIDQDSPPVPECTLRAAIEAANAVTPSKTASENPVAVIMHDIFFDGQFPEIEPVEELPPIERPTIINGSSQPEGKVRLVGGGRAIGFRLNASGSAVTGYEINGFVESAIEINADDVDIRQTTATGSQIGILVNAEKATIVNSVMSGNTVAGLSLRNASRSTIVANKIGTNSDGTSAVLNRIGVRLSGGRENEFRDNVISGNEVFNILIEETGSGGEINLFSLNRIGTNDDGTAALRSEKGPLAASVFDFGHSTVFDSNVISGNNGNALELHGEDTEVSGNVIGLTRDGKGGLGNDGFGIVLRGRNITIQANTISDNGAGGIVAEGAQGTSNIWDNKIGTDASGSDDLGNHGHGVVVRSAQLTRLQDNTISGNDRNGVELMCGYKAFVRDNLIGTDANGVTAIPNEGFGMRIRGCDANLRGNIISGNLKDGVVVDGGPVHVTFNKIGTDKAGQNPIANSGHGIRIGSGSTVGLSHNVISANGRSGISLSRQDPNDRLSLFRNKVGVNVTGVDPSDNMGNGEHGVHIQDGSSVVVRSDNDISSNAMAGILIESSESVEVEGNRLIANETGVQIVGGGGHTISGNQIDSNSRNIDVVGADRRSTIENNEVAGGTGDGTGIHLNNSAAVITGNNLVGDAGDAITVEEGGSAEIHENNFVGNGGLGVNNTDESPDVVATANWWGDASGPSGAGSGTGDGVSSNVDFGDWLIQPVSVVISTGAIEPVLAGESDTVAVFVNNWTNRGDVIDLSVEDDQGWVVGLSEQDVTLSDSAAGVAQIETLVPSVTADGSQSQVELIATSRSNPALADTLIFQLVAQTAAVVRLFVLPDSVAVLPGDTVRFQALGVDQLGREIGIAPNWSSSAGSIDENGVFVAPSERGDYVITAIDPSSQLESTAVVSVISSVASESVEAPTQFELRPNYPNPFNPSTRIEFTLPRATAVKLVVYDLLGRVVSTLVDETLTAGVHHGTFVASQLPSGLYFYVLETGDFRAARKMMLVK